MTARLRVVLDQVVAPTDADLRTASVQLARALIATTPEGCDVAAIVPSGTDAGELEAAVPGLADVARAPLARRELTAAWQMGLVRVVGGGMIHAPTMFAPLVKHDRVHNHDQTVVTVWDLRPWDAPEALPRGVVATQKALLKRAVRHADAVVVPTHALAERLGEIARLGSRIRVIAGAAPEGWHVPTDAAARVRDLGLPSAFTAVVGGAGLENAMRGLVAGGAADRQVVVLDVPEGGEPRVADIASAAGIPESHVHVRGALEAGDRAAVLGTADVLVAPSREPVFPWRVLDALALGTPIVAAASGVHADVLADVGVHGDAGGGDADAEALGAGIADALGPGRARARALAHDRANAFSWLSTADRVWQLHADL